MSEILVFDLGTTYFKVCLFDRSGQLIDYRRTRPNLQVSDEGRVEIAVDDFKRDLIKCTRALAERVGGLKNVAAVSFSSQTNSFVLLNKHHEPLTAIILWPDDRAIGLELPVADSLQRLGVREKTGVPRINHQYMISKFWWLRTQQPEIVEQTRYVCLLSDFFTWWLTGHHVTEAGIASLLSLVDVRGLQWLGGICQKLELPEEWLPSIVSAGCKLGALLPPVAKEFGLPADCKFIVGCLDQYAGAIGAGNITNGTISESTGTVLATIRCCDRFAKDISDEVHQGPAACPGMFYQMVFSEISAGLLERYRNSLPDRPSFDALIEEAALVACSEESLKLDETSLGRDGAAMFRNRSANHTRGHEVRAILEAVAQELVRQVGVLVGGSRPQIVRSVGGAARSDLWLTIKSEKLGCNVEALECCEPASLGAAMLAERALSGSELAELAQSWVRFRSINERV